MNAIDRARWALYSIVILASLLAATAVGQEATPAPTPRPWNCGPAPEAAPKEGEVTLVYPFKKVEGTPDDFVLRDGNIGWLKIFAGMGEDLTCRWEATLFTGEKPPDRRWSPAATDL